MADALYSRLNARGRKQFKTASKGKFSQKFPEYAKLGLPAHKAALNGDVNCLKEVFACNQDEGVPSRDVNGATPLHLAVRNNHVEAVKWMIRFTDLSPLTTAKHGETPVHVATVQGHTECLKLLLNAESKVDIRGILCTAIDNSGFTPLQLAVVKYRNECAKLLIAELGTKSLSSANESGITTAHVAASAGNVEVLKVIAQKQKKLLFQEAGDGTTPLYFASQEGRLDALHFLHVKGKCDLASPSSDGLKPIHAACQCGHTNIVKYIVSRLGNSAIFEMTPDGATPLHFAASAGMVPTARWLINSDVGGTLVTSKDKNGDTPAHDAADNGQTEVLQVLLDSGADLYAVNNDGNTPYSIALGGQHPETANYVMTYASKTSRKSTEEPSQMTIYDLQGEVGVADFGAPVTEAPVKEGTELGQEKVLPVKAPSVKKQGKEKKKKGKGKEKAPEKRSSFLSSTNPTLQSFEEKKGQKSSGPVDDKVLELTDEELALFKQQPKLPSEEAVVSKAPPSSDGSDIVVRYSDVDNREASPEKMHPDYSTVAEISQNEDRKEKKRGRKASKSIQSALKSRQAATTPAKSPENRLSGPELGFKPQFRSNPLQKMVVVEKRVPPTPPPTPATGGSSEVPSEEAQQPTDIDTYEDNDDDDDDDAMPYDVYSKPDAVVVESDTVKDEVESENKKLLKDALDDLSDEEPQEQKVSSEDVDTPEKEEDKSDSEFSEEEVKPKLTKMWPPPPEPETDKLLLETRAKPSGTNVLRKWPPAMGATEEKKPVVKTVPPPKVIKRQWPPPQPEPEKPTLVEKIKPLEPKPVVVPERKVVVEKPPSPQQKIAVSLRPVKREGPSPPDKEETTNLFPLTNLKKATKKTVTHGEFRETTSGAGDELRERLLKRQKV